MMHRIFRWALLSEVPEARNGERDAGKERRKEGGREASIPC